MDHYGINYRSNRTQAKLSQSCIPTAGSNLSEREYNITATMCLDVPWAFESIKIVLESVFRSRGAGVGTKHTNISQYQPHCCDLLRMLFAA